MKDLARRLLYGGIVGFLVALGFNRCQAVADNFAFERMKAYQHGVSVGRKFTLDSIEQRRNALFWKRQLARYSKQINRLDSLDRKHNEK